LWGVTKLSVLDREAKQNLIPEYELIQTAPALGLPFADRKHSEAVATWPTLPSLLPTFFPGVKTSRDPLVVDIDRNTLEERVRQYLDTTISSQSIGRIFPSAMKKTGRFNPEETRTALLADGFKPWQVLRYVYRPFDLRWIYWEPRTKLIGEKSEDYLEQPFNFTQWLEARQVESGESFSRGCVVSSLPDNFGNGFSTFFPKVTLTEGNLLSDVQILPNCSIAGRSYLDTVGGGVDHLFPHIVSIMHTPQYRSDHADLLLGNWPRIPLPATAELLIHSATLGRRLADFLDPESDIQLQAEWSFLALLHITAEFTGGTSEENDRRNAARFALTAGWGGAGQGATVMPRRGDAREREWTETEIARLTTLAAAQALTLENALGLLGQRCVDVYLNGDAHWSAVPVNVWAYTLGGYQVLKKWLSYREEPLLGRALREEEARYFAQIVRRITAILLLSPALDASYAAILPGATGLPA
jgi:hypothetical protein